MEKFFQISLCLLLFIFGTSAISACTCNWYSHRKDFRKAKAVFVGSVLSVEQDFSLPSIPEEIKDFKAQITEQVKLKVEKSWSGNKQSEITIWSFSYPHSCGGFRFNKGEKYLVYVFATKGNLLFTETSCGRTRPFETTNEEHLKEFNQLNSFGFRFWSRLNPF